MHDWKQLIRERLQPLRLNTAAEADLTDELAQHLEDQYREALSGGATDQDAYRKALEELDDLHPLRKQERRHVQRRDAVPAGDNRPGNFVEDLWRDLRYALRTMRKSPLFVMVVVVTLGLGIGANTTVFTVINTFILNPLPVPDAGRLAAVSLIEGGTTSKSSPPLPMSYADLKDYQARNGVFQSFAGYTTSRLITRQDGPTPQQFFGELITGDYFATLGLTPAAGRFFAPDEDSTPGAHPVAVMNYATWQVHFGGAPDVVGKTLRLNHIPFTVIGVAPPKFLGVNAIFGPDFWIPAAMMEQLFPNELPNGLTDRDKALFLGLGRLKPGETPARAQANLTTVASDLAREYPATDEGHAAKVMAVRDVVFGSSMGASSPILFGSAVLLIVVGIVLLIACSNVANLLLARSAARQQEMAVRLAMGASRPRLVRQLLTESVFLGILSGLTGLAMGYAGLHLLFGMLPSAANFPSPKIDGAVLAFSLAVSLATGFIFGAIPAFRTSRDGAVDGLKEARTMGGSRRKVTLANAMLVGQVALSFLLLVTAALFLRSIGRAYQVDPGFQTDHLAVFTTNPGPAGYSRAQTQTFYRDVRQRIERLPGVASVSWSTNLPLWGRSVTGLQVEGWQARSRSEKIRTIVSIVDRNFFETAGVEIEQGRGFTESDQESSMPVAIVNEKVVHDFWPNGDALGKWIQAPGETQKRRVVGIARNAVYSSWSEPAQLCVYLPSQQKYSDSMTLYVRTSGDPRQVLTPVQREIHAAGPQILLSLRTGREIVDGGLFQARAGVVLLTVFGLLALGLASIGLYGVLAYAVNQRRREIGLRMALGAAQGKVLGLILKQGMALVLAGLGIGLAASLVVGKLLSRMLYGVNAGDVVSVAAAAAVLLAVSLVACYLPARRASRVDPLVALREG
ncbi:MAG TPA: ABC transporter permease [Candidatus Sulfopaludibacter sp.]|nr:ABC transporter permease [Candidatus Sulfopaludibacter sp.]